LRLLVVFGIVFEMPLLSLLLTRAGLLTPEFLSRNRRYAIVLLFMGAAVLTPPDVLSMMMLAVPLMLLYEISILVARISRPRRPPGAA
jgi:sec-independent protein translocase protein TatC